ncbi:isoprenoid synthase domain-containing protein [Infundibulicybe gibba]|nr:isoprenoid synthase domain-containing protein [Infundibulicybe gibba]
MKFIESDVEQDFQRTFLARIILCITTRNTIRSFLRRCGLVHKVVPYDQEFSELCCAEAVQRGYQMTGPRSLRPFIPGGVVMATTAYAHLTDKSAQIFISLYTSFLIYLDDVFQHDITAVKEFNERFIWNLPQRDPVLNDFANLLFGLPLYFERIVSNMIITSTLNLVTALSLEYETQGMQLHQCATGYPTFSRIMSGASEAYGLFTFPRGLPIQAYIQALPDLMIYINNGNDVLSFYKEELAGEGLNRVSLLADCYATSKQEALDTLVDGAVNANDRVLQILAPYPGACLAYQHFRQGYIGFHASLARYKLGELNI